MAASLGYPFTLAQWKELERQAMIYKYMMASVPVPPELLFPLPLRNISDSSAVAAVSRSPHCIYYLLIHPSPLYYTFDILFFDMGCLISFFCLCIFWLVLCFCVADGGGSGGADGGSSILNLRFKGGVDPEVGRCRRTDGKKWRCTKDVAPNQKYCERHLHRGRPRSRKPVEVLINPPSPRHHHQRYATTALPNNTTKTTTLNPPAVVSPSPFIKSPPHPYHHLDPSSPFDLHTIASASSSSSSCKVPRWVLLLCILFFLV